MKISTFVAAVAVGVVSSVSYGQVLSMTYDDAAGSYSTTSGIFTASAIDIAGLRTSGDVSRLDGPIGTADFDEGFVSLPGQADFNLTLNTLVGDTAPTTGTFTATDHDGDTVIGDIVGVWQSLGAGFLAFTGTVANSTVDLSNNGSFDGDTGNWIDAGLPSPMTGAVVQLVFAAPGFFSADFNDRATGITIQLVPAPATAALAMMGLGVATRRRR